MEQYSSFWIHITSKPKGHSKTQSNRAPWKRRTAGRSPRLNFSQSFLIPVVEVEEALGRVHTQKGGHIFIVGEGGTKTDESDILLGHLNVPDGPGHQRF